MVELAVSSIEIGFVEEEQALVTVEQFQMMMKSNPRPPVERPLTATVVGAICQTQMKSNRTLVERLLMMEWVMGCRTLPEVIEKKESFRNQMRIMMMLVGTKKSFHHHQHHHSKVDDSLMTLLALAFPALALTLWRINEPYYYYHP